MSNNLNRILRLNALQSDSCNPGIKILRQNYFKWVNLISSSILTPRPNSYCSVYTIPADLFQEEELEVTSLSEEPVTAIIQWEIFQKLISKHNRTRLPFFILHLLPKNIVCRLFNGGVYIMTGQPVLSVA